MTGRERAGRRRSARGAVAAFLACALPARAAAGLEAAADETGEARVALVGPAEDAARIRAVVGELLSREGIAVAWSYPPRFRADDVLAEAAAGEEHRIAAWIDLSPPGEARLYFRDAARQRFVIRRLPRGPVLDEVAVEEIGQIAKSVVLALGSGTASALSRTEARAVLRERPRGDPAPAPDLTSAPSPAPDRRLSVELAALATAQRFSPQISWSERVEIGAVGFLLRGSNGPGIRSALGGWLAVGYTLPIEYRAPTVGLELQTATLRGGLLWEPWRSRRALLRLGAGGGVDAVIFQPRALTSEVVAAPSDRFLTPMVSLSAAAVLDAWRGLSVSLGAVLDLALTDVHYDLQDAAGRSTRVLAPFLARPGAVVAVAWRF